MVQFNSSISSLSCQFTWPEIMCIPITVKDTGMYWYPPNITSNTLFFQMTDYFSVTFWVRSSILDLTQNLDLTRESWPYSSKVKISQPYSKYDQNHQLFLETLQDWHGPWFTSHPQLYLHFPLKIVHHHEIIWQLNLHFYHLPSFTF